MPIGSATLVADLATQYPATIRVFQRHRIDFCCGGRRPLGEVCREQALDLEALRRELEAAVAGPDQRGTDWRQAPLEDLIAHIVDHYHGPLAEELPRLAGMMEKVLRVHGERHPELEAIAASFGVIARDLPSHLSREERVLFPLIGRLESGRSSPQDRVGSDGPDLAGPIGGMESEHETVGEALAALRERTGGFTAPPDACNTFRGLYHGFAELERDLHEHIHLENNILFPRALGLRPRPPEAGESR